MLKSLEIVPRSKKPLFQQKFRKELYHFDRNSQFRSVMLKWPTWTSGVGQKNPTPTPSVVRNSTPTPTKNLRLLTARLRLRLRNPGTLTHMCFQTGAQPGFF